MIVVFGRLKVLVMLFSLADDFGGGFWFGGWLTGGGFWAAVGFGGGFWAAKVKGIRWGEWLLYGLCNFTQGVTKINSK